jgi:glycosyltransferase involved in cell wall biosynthesis
MTALDLHGRRVLFVVNVDWFFLSHRLPIARAARDAGAEVLVATAGTGRQDEITSEGFRYVAMPFTRSGRRPLREAATLLRLIWLYARLRPDVIHHVTVKPVLYGGIAARLVARRARVVNAISGLGFAFSEDRRARRVGRLVVRLYRKVLRNPRSRTIFQNPQDRERFVSQGLVAPSQAVLIRGSGVDCDVFRPGKRPHAMPPTVLMSSRMLWEKGIAEYVEAAGIVRAARPDVQFELAGAPDPGNPTSVPEEQLRAWDREGVITWIGHRHDLPDVLRATSIYCLPTYYPEGVPKALLEAAATALPLVASSIAGCREVVQDGVTGLLVPPRDAPALANALLRVLADDALARSLGTAARALAEREFAESVVVEQTLELYAELLAAP